MKDNTYKCKIFQSVTPIGYGYGVDSFRLLLYYSTLLLLLLLYYSISGVDCAPHQPYESMGKKKEIKKKGNKLSKFIIEK